MWSSVIYTEYEDVIYTALVIEFGMLVLHALNTRASIPVITYKPHVQHKFHPLSLVSKVEMILV